MTTKHNHHREWQGPMLMALAGILVLLALVSESIRQDDVSVARRLDAISSHVGQTVQLRLKANTEYLSLLADEMSAKTLDELQFQQIVSQYVIDNRDLIYVTWADSNFVIRWTAPFEPNKQVIGLSQSLPESRRASHEAKLSKRPVWTEPFEVIQGISAVEVCIPVFRGNEFIGTFSGVHSIQVLLGNDLPQSLNNNYDIALVNTEGKRYRATSILKEIDHELTRVIQLELPGGQLKLIVSAYETEPHWYLLTLTMLCICLVAGMAYSQWSLNRQLSQRKRTEKELQDGENKLLEAQGIAELGYYALDVKTGSWTNSAELNGIFGIDESYTKDIVGWLNLVHPDHRETMANYLQDDVLGQHMRFDKEYKIIDATTGREKWVHGLGILKFDENNVPVEMLGTIQNITERKRVVEALRESEAKYKGIVESSHDAIMLTGPDGIVSYISPACKQVLGYDAEELVGKQPWIIHPDDLKKVKNIFYSTMQ